MLINECDTMLLWKDCNSPSILPRDWITLKVKSFRVGGRTVAKLKEPHITHIIHTHRFFFDRSGRSIIFLRGLFQGLTYFLMTYDVIFLILKLENVCIRFIYRPMRQIFTHRLVCFISYISPSSLYSLILLCLISYLTHLALTIVRQTKEGLM